MCVWLAARPWAAADTAEEALQGTVAAARGRRPAEDLAGLRGGGELVGAEVFGILLHLI